MRLILDGHTEHTGLHVQVFEADDDHLAEYDREKPTRGNELFPEAHPDDPDRPVCAEHYRVLIDGQEYPWTHSHITPHDRTILVHYPSANIQGRARLYLYRHELGHHFDSFNSERLL